MSTSSIETMSWAQRGGNKNKEKPYFNHGMLHADKRFDSQHELSDYAVPIDRLCIKVLRDCVFN
jgi:hypothetical protein